MAVHVRLEGDRAAAHTYLPLAYQLLHRVRQLAAASGAAVTGKHLNPDEFTLIYAMKMAEFEVVQIHCTPRTEGRDTLAEQPLPDILSGWTRGATISEEPSPPVKRYLTAFKPSPLMAKPGAPAASWGRSQQLAVAPSALALEFPPATTDATDSQYRRVFASNYSGAMAKCVQTLLGYGRPKKTKMLQGLPAPANGTQVVYDYRYYRTHGLTKFEDKWWLVEISSARGIVVCELEMYPDSYARGKGSSRADIKEMAEALHGFPTGRGMLQGATFDNAVLAGTAVELMDAATLRTKFYKDWLPHSTALGWLFTPDGSQAHITGWRQRYREREGAHLMASIALKREQDGKLGGSARVDVCDKGRLPDKYHVLTAYEPLTDSSTTPGGEVIEQMQFPCSTPVHVYWEGEGVKQLRFMSEGRKDREQGYKIDVTGAPPATVDIPKDPGPGVDKFTVPIQEASEGYSWVAYPADGVYSPNEKFEAQKASTSKLDQGFRSYGSFALNYGFAGLSGQQWFFGGAYFYENTPNSPNPWGNFDGGFVTGPGKYGMVGFIAKYLFGVITKSLTVAHVERPRRVPYVPRGLRDGFGEVLPAAYKTTSRGAGASFSLVSSKEMAMFTMGPKLGPINYQLTDEDKEQMVCEGTMRRTWWNRNDPYSSLEFVGGPPPQLSAREEAIYALHNIKGRFPTGLSAGTKYSDFLAYIMADTPEVRALQGLNPYPTPENGGSNSPRPLPTIPYTTEDTSEMTSPTQLEVTTFGRKHAIAGVQEVAWDKEGLSVYGAPECVASAYGNHAAVIGAVFPATNNGEVRPRDTRFSDALQGEDSTQPAHYFNFVGAP